MMISQAPVPIAEGRPRTILADGDFKSSKSPCNVASEMKLAVVSKDALRRGELLVEIPFRLNGLNPPSYV